ncbi:hypothetical protein LDENG_00219650 [Lucifuga dentata]|nr:hypothetical protein LDENG_00219650 [Lucifuga dentata]
MATWIFLCCLLVLQGKASEYQLESDSLSQCERLRNVAVAKQQGDIPHCTEDGMFRPVQCSGRGQECWCVDAEGHEVIGTRTNSSIPHCLSPCQQQTDLLCSASGIFLPVQCDSSRGRCWCVDQDGVELYGTRQTGRPERCPGSCEVRVRRLLHGSGQRSPPQCDDAGNFLPVQCKFINSTDRSELQLLHAFSSFPEAFETFSRFRKFFPLVSSYCFCSDSRGRELVHTGLELLLSEVYDTAFSSRSRSHSFSQSNIYRVLQRRMLGVRLALTGHFRCPSSCEVERQVAKEASNVFVPSCEEGGAYTSKQCQQGGQCWCVDGSGREIPGSRRHGDAVTCGSAASCLSQRRLALSRLFSGPVAPPVFPSSSSSSSFSSAASLVLCRSLLQPLKELLPAGEAEPVSFLSRLVEVLHGLLPSVGGALQALKHSSPRRLQENLFGGKFLKNAAAFNFSGAVGAHGAISLDQISSQDQTITANLQRNQGLVQYISQVLEDPAFLSTLQHTLEETRSSSSTSLQQVLSPVLRSCSEEKEEEEEEEEGIFVPSCTASGGFQEVQCQGDECWCVDSQERAMALKMKGKMAVGAEVYIPACSEAGDFLRLQCVAGSSCFCVDAEGKQTGPAGGAVTCPEETSQNFHSAGPCAQALHEVTLFREEVDRIVSLSNSSHFPLGYGFLLAKGLRLTPEELQTSQSTEELQVSDWLLSQPQAALRLAASSTVQMYLPAQCRSYKPFTPQCDATGYYAATQCYLSTGQCWCVDENGLYIPGSLTSRSLRMPKCLTRCQRAHAHTLLSDWMRGSDISSDVIAPQCEEDGSFSVLQTGSAAAWCVNPQTGDAIQTATPDPAGQLTCPSWCELQGSQCRPDGSFMPLQCDVTSCWCVSEDGQEVSRTRTPRQAGSSPSCDRPLCPAPSITHGALLCHTLAVGHQSCDLICHRGYQNALPVSSFLCEAETRQWEGRNKLVGGACQISRPLQTVSSSQTWILSSSCSNISSLQTLLFSTMTSRGLCSAQLPVSGRSVSLCSSSSLRLQCDDDDVIRLTVRWTASLSDLPTSDLPDLHDIGVFLNASRFVGGAQGLLGNMLTAQPRLVSVTAPSFGCFHGYQLDSDGEGCIVCPAGTFSNEGACLLCPEGTYQNEEGRDFCNTCPRGSSSIGASSVNQCVTECQRRYLRCSNEGDFLLAQPDSMSDRWRCVTREGVELEWTASDVPLTDEECSVLSRFQVVPGSELIVGANDTEVLQTMTSDLRTCVQVCAVDPSCIYVAFYTENTRTQCELYSTHTLNTYCNTSQQAHGFLGNPQAELFDWLSCSLSVRGGASDLVVIRKKGEEFSMQQQQQSFVRMKMMKAVSGVFRTLVFRRTTLANAHRFCQDGCSRHVCCDGFILNRNTLNGGSVLCGWLRAPPVLMCGDQDWDVIGQGKAHRVCGAGLTYNEQQKSFMFDFGGQTFTITDSSLPADSKNKKDYQASIISFQEIYLNTGT